VLRTRSRFELLRARCVPSDDPDGARWRLDWGAAPDGAAGEAVRLSALRIRGVPARALRRIEVRDAGRAVFVLESIADASGRLTSAGTLLEAMVAMTGRAGLEIDLAGRRPALPSIVVRLEVAACGGSSGAGIALEATLD
jgi:hypothetical protein